MHYVVGMVIPKEYTEDEIDINSYIDNNIEKFYYYNDEYNQFEPELTTDKDIKRQANVLFDAIKKDASVDTALTSLYEIKKLLDEGKYREIIRQFDTYDEDTNGNFGYNRNPYGTYDWCDASGGRWVGRITPDNEKGTYTTIAKYKELINNPNIDYQTVSFAYIIDSYLEIHYTSEDEKLLRALIEKEPNENYIAIIDFHS
jgi:hypothetical protein